MAGTTPASCTHQVCWLPMSSIMLRTEEAFTERESLPLELLRDSIVRSGLMEPITVRSAGQGRYAIVSGNRRFLACRMAGLTHIDAIILPVPDAGCTDLMLLRRIQDGQLHYLEEAEALRTLLSGGMTRDDLARFLGRTAAAVTQRAHLAELDGELRAFLFEHGLQEGYARSLSRLPDRQARMAIARQIATQGLCIRDTELLVNAAIRRLPVPPPSGGRTISLMRDHRLYLNAIQSVVEQMKEAGVAAEMTREQTPEAIELFIRIPLRPCAPATGPARRRR